MPKIRMMQPAVRTLDTRAVKPAPKRADANLLTPQHRAWREQVLDNAGYRCEAVEDGRRCTRAAPAHRLFADHIKERQDGGAPYDPKNGMCLCGSHHTRKTVRARARRLGGREGGSNP